MFKNFKFKLDRVGKMYAVLLMGGGKNLLGCCELSIM